MVLEQALKAVCDELEKHDPDAAPLHFAKGVLAASTAVVAYTEPRHANALRLPEDEIVAHFVAGEGAPSLAKRYGCSSETIYRMAQRRGISGAGRPRGRPSKVLQQLPEVIAAYKSGKSLLELEQEFKSSVATIRKHLEAAGVEIRKPSTGKVGKVKGQQRIGEIMALRAEGKTGQEIGSALGITRERVRQIVLKCGKREEFEQRPFTASEIEALEEYRAGAALPFVAEKLGVCQETTRRYLLRYGIPIRPSRKRGEARQRTQAIAAKIAQRYRAGESLADIAKEAGFAKPEQIYRYLAIAGVKPDRQTRFWQKQAVAA